MSGLLRFIAILNAAVWCGSAIFLVVGLPAVFSPELKRLLSDPGVGFAAETLVARYFVVQYWCAGIALVVLAAESVYSNRRGSPLLAALVLGLLAIALAGGLIAQPHMAQLHKTKYFGPTAAARLHAAQQFAVWHGTSEAINLLAIAGLVVYLWKVSAPPEQSRSSYFPKIRG